MGMPPCIRSSIRHSMKRFTTFVLALCSVSGCSASQSEEGSTSEEEATATGEEPGSSSGATTTGDGGGHSSSSEETSTTDRSPETEGSTGTATDSSGGSGPGTDVPQETTWGCEMMAYSEQFEVELTTYGAGELRVEAIEQAVEQCRAADFQNWFCQESRPTCEEEAVEQPVECTWSNYSATFDTTVFFYGSGSTPSEAKHDAVTACLDDGGWQGWFCLSGELEC